MSTSTHAPAAVPASRSDDVTASENGARRRRILMLMEDLGGGTGNHVSQMLAQASLHGWEATIVTQTPPLVRKIPPGVDVKVVSSTGWSARFPLTQLRRFIGLRRTVRALRPDVVHTYFFWSIIYGRLLKLMGDVEVLVENREDLGFSWGRGAYAVLRLTRAIPDRIICVAEAVRHVALERERVHRRRTTVIHNGIPTSLRHSANRSEMRRRFGFRDAHVVVGMVANLPRAVKGGSRLLDAVSDIVAAAPHVRFLLLGLGTDQETLAPELASRGIEAYVVGAGYRIDVDACYAAMDVSVLTSSTEGLSITILESMRHGLPLVVTRVGGNQEAVLDGVTGFLVPVGDRAEFVQRVVALAESAELRRAMGDAGRRRVTERFSIADVAERYRTTYEEVIEAGRQRPAIGKTRKRRRGS